jgi:hypothetical protein
MKKLFTHLPTALFAITSLFTPLFAASETAYPICDLHSEGDITRYAQFDELKLSKGGRFSENGLIELLDVLPLQSDNLVIFDLSDECHGFINGLPVYWNDFRDSKELEQEFLTEAQDSGYLWIQENDQTDPLCFPVSEAITESDLVGSYGHIYARYPLEDGHLPHKFVDQFVQFIHDISPDYWIHFHDRTGGAKSSTMLILTDIIRSDRQLSLQDIMEKHEIKLDLADFSSDEELMAFVQQRLEFICDFYDYCQEVPDFSMSWSEWISLQTPPTPIRECPATHHIPRPYKPFGKDKIYGHSSSNGSGSIGISVRGKTDGSDVEITATGTYETRGTKFTGEISRDGNGNISGSGTIDIRSKDKDKERDRNKD